MKIVNFIHTYAKGINPKEDCLKCVPTCHQPSTNTFLSCTRYWKGERPTLRDPRSPSRFAGASSPNASVRLLLPRFGSLRKVPGGGHLPAFAGLCQLPPAGPGLHGLAHWILGIWHFSGAWMLEFGPFPPPSAHPALTLRVPFVYPNCTLRQPLPAKQHSREKYARYSHLKNYKSLAQTTCKSRKSNLLGPKTPRKRAIFRNIFCRNSASLGT